MATPQKRTRFQIDASTDLRDLAKEVAARHRLSLTEYVLVALAAYAKNHDDKDLASFIEKELAAKPKPGRPQK
jgi:uncharacterized protein (DUF1778 family)